MAFDHIAVIGAGAWGTALALTCLRAGRTVTLWEADAGKPDSSATRRESRFLPGVRLPDAISLPASSARPRGRTPSPRWFPPRPCGR